MDKNEEMINALGELVAIPSVTRKEITEEAPLGKYSAEALKKALEICEGLGFRTKNCSNIIGWAEIGEGEEMIGVLCHLDVVSASETWNTDPFKLTRKDGRLYGRGTVDDKGPAVQCIYAMKELLDRNIFLKRRIRIIFGLSEEAGSWDDMEYYKANEEMPVFGITPDADFPVICGEKGILNLELSMDLDKSKIVSAEAGSAVNVVPDKCRIVYKDKNNNEKTISAEGKASHASLPEMGMNAISECIDMIKDDIDSPFVEFYADHIKKEIYGESLGCAFEDEKSGKLTLNAGMLRIEAQKLILSLDIRVPIDYSYIDVVKTIEKYTHDYGIEIKNTAWKAPVYMDKSGDVIQTLLNTYIEMTGDKNAQAKTIGGGTYSRAMDNIAAFGAAFPGHENREHMDDEFVLEEDMILGRKIYEKALERLANI